MSNNASLRVKDITVLHNQTSAEFRFLPFADGTCVIDNQRYRWYLDDRCLMEEDSEGLIRFSLRGPVFPPGIEAAAEAAVREHLRHSN